MNARIKNPQIIRDAAGKATFAVIPFAEYQALLHGKKVSGTSIPNEVAELVLKNGYPPAKAWREYLDLTQAEVACRMAVSQSAYAQLEGSDRLRVTSRQKIATAMGLEAEQLDL